MGKYGASIKELREPWMVWEVSETWYPFLLNAVFVCVVVSYARSIWFSICFSRANLLLFVVWLVFTVLSVDFPYFINVVQSMCSLSERMRLIHVLGNINPHEINEHFTFCYPSVVPESFCLFNIFFFHISLSFYFLLFFTYLSHCVILLCIAI